MTHVALFGRRRSARSDTQESPGKTGAIDVVTAGDAADVAAATETAAAAGAGAAVDDVHVPEAPFSRFRGPFDSSEVTAGEDWVDFGAIWLPRTEAIEVRLEIDQTTDTITGIHLVHKGSTAQLQAYAAPRTFGLWPDIRGEIADGVVAQGGQAEVVDGILGKELKVALPDGSVMRLHGVDGPRWFLRAVVHGPAATDDTAAVTLLELVRGVAIDRGTDARPPREVLPLRLPPEAQQVNDDATDSVAGTSQRTEDDLRPFERGPEIIEVR